VVAVPLRATVERHQEQVGARERFESLGRAALLEDDVAERAGHGFEHGGAGQQAELVGRQSREQLGEEVVGHVAVVAAECGHALRPGRARVGRKGRQVEAGRPALRVFGELGDLGVGQVESGGAEQLACLGLVHAELVGSDLERQAACPQRPQRQHGVPSRQERQLRPLGDMPRQRGDRVQARLAVDQMQVVEDEHDRLFHRRERRAEAWDQRSLDRHAEHDRHRRLRLQQADQRFARHSPGATMRRTQLRLQQLKRPHRPGQSTGASPRQIIDQ
jgi:hypothetical protein